MRDLPDPLRLGFAFAAVAYVSLMAVGLMGYASDVRIWWAARPPDPYQVAVYSDGALGYFYSPAFAQALAPFTALPEPVFAALWTALLLGALYAVVGRWAIAALVFPPVAIDIAAGNIHVLFALVAVYGLRYPALWTFPLLTKVTPGLGVLWFVLRREWRNAAIAFRATAAVVLVSFALAPSLWTEWVGLLAANTGADVTYPHVPVPMLYRLPFAVLLLAWGALTDRRWTIPVAMLLSLPVMWPGSFALLVAAWATTRRDSNPQAGT